jgi:hypothetical protein
MKIDLRITDTATARLIKLKADVAARGDLMERLGQRTVEYLKDHFQQREMQGGKTRARGWPSQHIWAGIAEATQLAQVTPDTATIRIASRILAHKITGGTVRPGPGKRYLAIPLRAAAYGKSPGGGQVPGLFFLRTKKGRQYLMKKGAKSGPLKAALSPWYRLVTSVTHQPDPQALPSFTPLRHSLATRVNTWAAQLTTAS